MAKVIKVKGVNRFDLCFEPKSVIRKDYFQIVTVNMEFSS